MNIVKSVIICLSVLYLVSCNHQFQKKFKRNFKHSHKKNRIANNSASEHIIVETENGLVEGEKVAEKLYAFRGIPYAKPPIDHLRFELPKAPNNWTGTWNATYDRSSCISGNSFFTDTTFQTEEDCLYINVYIPQYPTTNVLLPVMVWIYGGGFSGGNSSYDFFGPDYLVQQNVVFVSFNYRLGIFGFLSTGDKAAPGNNGLQDQIFALKWVKRNIKAFGGDPANVTIFGQSAGAASVSYLILSRRAKGLFKSAIMESGSALCLWTLSRTARKAAFSVGNELKIHTTDSSELVRQLKKVPASNLQTASGRITDLILLTDPLNGLVYAPVIEPEHKNAVLTNYSYELLVTGNFDQVPSIIGFNSNEGEVLMDPLLLLQFYLVSYDLFPARLVPVDMNANKSDLNIVGQKIKTHYAGQNGRLTNPSNNFTLYANDDQFIRPILKTAEFMSKYRRTYLYKFSYTTDQNSTGARHGEELKYIFKYNLTTPEEIKMRNCMVRLFTNFAKYNDPTPSSDISCANVAWKPITPNNGSDTYYLSIDKNTTLSLNPSQRDQVFWNELYDEYGHRPYDTY